MNDQNERTPETAIKRIFDRIGDLIRQGNRRRLELRNPQGGAIFSLPLTIAVLIGVFLLWRVPLLLVIAVVVALVLKAQFVFTRDPDVEIIDPKDD